MFPKETRILIVDDMPAMRQIVKSECRRLGFRNTVEAENGRDAFTLLGTSLDGGQPIGLVLSDWNMPIMTGLALLEAVRQSPEFKHLPFLLITAEGEKRQVLQAIQLGVSNYMVKPFTPAMFSEKVLSVWKKHNPAGGGATPAAPVKK